MPGQYSLQWGEHGVNKKNPERKLNMLAYEFYSIDGCDDVSLIGILPERRKHRRRVTRKSIMKWGKLAAGSYTDPNSIYYIKVWV
jgi:hypothetical protein